VTGCAKRGD